MPMFVGAKKGARLRNGREKDKEKTYPGGKGGSGAGVRKVLTGRNTLFPKH